MSDNERSTLWSRLRSMLAGLGRKRSAAESEALALPPMSRGMQLFAMLAVFLLGVALTAFVLANPLGLEFLPQLTAGDTASPRATAPEKVYQCPMHPEVIEDHEADCPICGMKLVEKKQAATAEPAKIFQCPMHPEVIEDHEADCPVCGMKLVEKKQTATAEPAKIYQCPMHPEVIEDHEADCPVCGMKLVEKKSAARASAGSDGEREILYWYAPMDPTYMRHEPGLSPMGMQLVPKYADEGGGPGVIEIDPVQVQNIGVVSAPARKGEISRAVRTVGILDFNADLITWINTKFSGWIEKVHVNYVGQEVQAGQPLFEIYSPELVTTQEEYLDALDYAASLAESRRGVTRRQAESLLRSTRDRLAYWDISEDQIELLEQTRTVQRRLTVRSPASGVVAEVMDQALEGMFVKAGMNLYRIADMSSIWVHADVYEADLPWVRENQPASVSFRFDPDRVYSGKILFLYPEVSEETRTLKICVEVPNPRRNLRAGMYSDVVIRGPALRDATLIPNSAVLRSGERELVFIDLGEGRFAPREVELGIRGEGDVIQVLRGLLPGESVVTQAQFMLDSESRVQEAIAKFMKRTQGSGG